MLTPDADAPLQDLRFGSRRELRLPMPEKSPAQVVAATVAKHIESWTGTVPGLERYVGLAAPQAADEATALIAHLWSTPSRRRVRRAAAPQPRVVPIPVGTRFGSLVVLSPRQAAAGSSAQDGHVVRVRCDCGQQRAVPATELRRTRGPLRYCGLRCPLIPRPAYQGPAVGAETIRLWALDNGVPIGLCGRLPARVIAAYLAAHVGTGPT